MNEPIKYPDPKPFVVPENLPSTGYQAVGGKLVSCRVDSAHDHMDEGGDIRQVLEVTYWDDGKWAHARTNAGRLYATPGDAWLGQIQDLEGSIENAIEAIAKIEQDLHSYREQLALAQGEALRLLGSRVLGGGNLPRD